MVDRPNTFDEGWAKRRDVQPEAYSFDTLYAVGNWFESHLERLGQGVDWFWKSVLDWTTDPGDPDYWFHQANLPHQGKMYMPNHVTAIISCCVASKGAQESGEERVAWTYAADARTLASRMMEGYTALWASKEDFAKKGAAARHAENRSMKQQAIDAYKHGNYASKDAAAEAISGKIVPVKYRTVRDWLKGIAVEP